LGIFGIAWVWKMSVYFMTIWTISQSLTVCNIFYGPVVYVIYGQLVCFSRFGKLFQE
jgi:hypothetical protein